MPGYFFRLFAVAGLLLFGAPLTLAAQLEHAAERVREI